MTPWLILAAVIAILALALWLGRRLERARLAMERDEAEREARAIEAEREARAIEAEREARAIEAAREAERRAAAREAREEALWNAIGALLRRPRPGLTDTDARHALALDTLRRRALGGRQDRWAA